MMYKSFKHKKTSLSSYTLFPKLNTRGYTNKLGFLSSLIWSAAHPLILCSAMRWRLHQASLLDLARSLTRSVRISPDR
ncbi:hypothetical protein HanOQP8_Chr10g0356971 [Helianthus annuus]|nr:hypothetical protein HanOQP8_Chr10g0356971 [Helianthus annuus]KAJ0882847.1 hypothetical protein HanPSC8_Chr10g0414381 [Helianthus annuus]